MTGAIADCAIRRWTTARRTNRFKSPLLACSSVFIEYPSSSADCFRRPERATRSSAKTLVRSEIQSSSQSSMIRILSPSKTHAYFAMP